MAHMTTTSDIIDTIGPDRFREILNIGPKSVKRARNGQFTASWYRVIAEELKSIGHPEPPLELFTFIPEGGTPGLKKRGRKPSQPPC